MNTNPPTTKAQRAILRRILTAPHGQLIFVSGGKRPFRQDTEDRMIRAGLITRSSAGMFKHKFELTDVGREIAETGA